MIPKNSGNSDLFSVEKSDCVAKLDLTTTTDSTNLV